MKKIQIFVEGVADIKFIRDYIKYLYPSLTIIKDIDEKYNETLEFEKDDLNLVIENIRVCDNVNIVKRELQKSADKEYINIIIFDADENINSKRQKIEQNFQGLYNDLFLFPNNNSNGCIEDLLEKIMIDSRPKECWEGYEEKLLSKNLSVLSKKTKLYVWLENILGSSSSKKKKCKEINRDYSNKNIWDLDSEFLKPLKDFLDKNILL